MLSGVEKFNAANKQKWISLEMLLQMMDQIGSYYQDIDENEKAIKIKEYTKALQLIEIFQDGNNWYETYKTKFNHSIDALKLYP